MTRVAVTVLRCGCQNVNSEFHRVGIEVCLDVVFNHTEDGNWGSTCDSPAAVATGVITFSTKATTQTTRPPMRPPIHRMGS